MCHSLQSCDLQRDRGQIGAGFIRVTDAIRLGLQALPEGSECWMGPMGPLRPRLWLMPREHQGGMCFVKGLADAPDTQRHDPRLASTDVFGTWCRSHFQGQCESSHFQGHVFKPQKTAPDLQTGLEIAEQTHPGATFQPLTFPILEE